MTTNDSNAPDDLETNNSDDDKSEPKIVVDDDWKTRVEREKEELKDQKRENAADSEMPEASFPLLITTMATQALANLGQLPDPIEGKPVVRKAVAKHFIDTLSILEEKTKGNLTDEEKEMLEGTLHQLRLIFVSVSDSTQVDLTQDAPSNKPSGSSSIEIPS